jgi:chemosensory pili system protein ChpA (sensor histidine kinase/response regulator)
MVGLAAFGECAWEMEQLMNHWRAQSLAATPDLLTLVRDARELLSEWTYALQGEADPAIDAGGIAARAREMRGEPAAAAIPETPRAAVEHAAPAAHSVVSAASEVTPGSEYMTVSLPPLPDAAKIAKAPETAARPAPPSSAALCDQALADLGDRLAWLKGLVEEIGNQTSTNALANSRLHEIASMMNESMAEASALHRTLADHIAALKNNA